MKKPFSFVCVVSLLIVFNQKARAATFTLAEKPEYRAPMTVVCKTLGIGFQEDVQFSTRTRVVNGLDHTQIDAKDFYFLVRNFDKQVTLGVNKPLSIQIYQRKSSVPEAASPKNTKQEMEQLARATTAKLGYTLDDSWKNWSGWRGVPEGNYGKLNQQWSFLWNRHLGKHPLGNEFFIVQIDDVSRQVILFHNTTTQRKYDGLTEPKLTPEQGREAAIQAERSGREPRPYDDPAKFKIGTHERMLTFYYVQELPIAEQSKEQQGKHLGYRLRLCYGCYVGYWERGKETEPLRVIDLEFVDANTGEMVIRNKDD